MKRAWFWSGALVLTAAFYLAMHWLAQPPIPSPARRLDHAVRLPGTSVTLPDSPAHASADGYSYELTFTPEDSRSELWAIYLENATAPLSFYVNGQYIGASHLVAPSLLPRARPCLIDFPSALLKPGANVVRIHADLREGRVLSAVYVAPDAELSPIYHYAYRVHITLVRVIALASLLLSLVYGILFFLRPADRSYGWVALSCFLWVLHALGYLVPDAALVNRPSWSFWSIALLGWSTAGSVMFFHSLLGVRAPRIEQALWTIIAIASLILLVPPVLLGNFSETFARDVWNPLFSLVVLYTVWPLVRANLRGRNFEAEVLLAATLFVLSAGIHDGVTAAAADQIAPLPYLNYAVNVMMAAIFATLVRRFVRALHEVEALNRDLEQRVAQKAQELRESLVRLKDVERDQALSAERERIMRDMHDGIGGRLVATIASIPQTPELRTFEEMLRGLLDELRMIIDSLDPLEGDLPSVLGTLRQRIEKKLPQAGITLVWEVGDLPPLPDFGPRKVLQVMRIVQEAITNVIKHAGATSIRVRTRRDEGNVAVEIADNGRGLAATHDPGRGIGNMRHRARELGGALDVTSGAGGTTVRLLLPFQGAAA